MSQISDRIGALRSALVTSVNAAQLPPCIVGLVLEQVRTQVRLLEAQEEAQTQEGEEHNGALHSTGEREGSGGAEGGR